MSAPLKTPQQLIADCQGLVRSLAWQIHCKLPPHVELEDLVSYGQIGLAEAARDYDPERASQFVTYAYYRVRGAIFDGLSKMNWFSQADYNRGAYHASGKSDVSQEAECGERETKRVNQQSQSRSNVSGESILARLVCHQFGNGDADDQQSSTKSPAEVIIEFEMIEKLHELIDTLPHQARDLIRGTYFEGLSLKDAGERLGISKAWASRLHSKTLVELAESFRLSHMAD